MAGFPSEVYSSATVPQAAIYIQAINEFYFLPV